MKRSFFTETSMRASRAVVLIIAGSLAGAAACAPFKAPDCELCGNGGSSGADGGGGSSGNGGTGAGGSASGCDPTTTSKPIASSCGVFVSSSKGSDANEGSQAKPVKSFAKAIALAKGKPIYACGEGFDQALEISSGLTIFGALDCKNGWAYDVSKPTEVAPIAAGPALTVTGGGAAVEVTDFVFTAKDGSKPGESSIGAFVHDAAEVSLVRVAIEAGVGVAGQNGSVETYSYPSQTDLNGHDANGLAGGALNACSCPGTAVQTIGGGGGDGPTPEDGNPGSPNLGGGAAGTVGSCSPNGAGHDGAPAPSTSFAAGAAELGKLTSAGWEQAAGENATDGGPGQGGGGGASVAAGGGGGGGCGGCGGAGAKGAKGGGASVALLIFQSTLTLESSRVSAKDAGDGGKGLPGQHGQPIFGFNGNGAMGGCRGGGGGPGGDGGASGGGAGGVSAAILYKGAKPKLAKTSSAHGAPGKKGVGGDPGHNDGVAGKSGDLLEAP